MNIRRLSSLCGVAFILCLVTSAPAPAQEQTASQTIPLFGDTTVEVDVDNGGARFVPIVATTEQTGVVVRSTATGPASTPLPVQSTRSGKRVIITLGRGSGVVAASVRRQELGRVRDRLSRADEADRSRIRRRYQHHESDQRRRRQRGQRRRFDRKPARPGLRRQSIRKRDRPSRRLRRSISPPIPATSRPISTPHGCRERSAWNPPPGTCT